MNHDALPISLSLFFTHGNSLASWDKAQLLHRELALYYALNDLGVKTNFITYAPHDKRDYAHQHPAFTISDSHLIPRKRIYSRLIPVLHWRRLRNSDVFKTNQMRGSDIALRCARIFQKPLIVRMGFLWTQHAENQFGAESKAAQKAHHVEKTVLPQADRIIVTTTSIEQNIIERFPELSAKIHVIPNYVDLNVFHPKPAEKKYDVIFIGRLEKQKNIHLLLKAIAQNNAKALIIGRGSYGELVQEALQDANGRIEWREAVPNTELPAYINQAKLFALVSAYEGHPKALIEAMACGAVVLGTDHIGIREVIHHDETGWLCAPDADNIAQALRFLLEHPEVRERLGKAAADYARAHYDLKSIALKEKSILLDLASKGRADR